MARTYRRSAVARAQQREPGIDVPMRRVLFAVLVASSVLVLIGLSAVSLSVGGYDGLDAIIAVLFAVTLPWTAIGFWNAVIGLALMRRTPDPAKAVCPSLVDVNDRSEIVARTALLSCIRNEDAGLVGRNLDLMIEGLIELGIGERFDVFVLSDSDRAEVITAEEARIAALAERWHDRMSITYRRRANNLGYKAGNIRDFCRRWGSDYDFMLVLDADSLMAPDTIARMVRTMQSDPRLGILQTLIAGLPTLSAFARPFQFGMRLGMRSYSLGSAWWQADAGPYWGHNALIRTEPFVSHCHLPRLPGRGPLSGWILSHDQVEAALMRRAGYEVRVMLVERGSWEESPTTLLEFIQRDLRWCHGNLQYLKLLGLPGLHPVSRIQMLLAILMFIASPAWVGLMLLGALRFSADGHATYDPAIGALVLTLVLTMVFAPKLATILDALTTAAGRRRFGGTARLLSSSTAEIVFSALLAPIMAIAHTLFIGRLVLGRSSSWGAQRRVLHRVPPREAVQRLWPQTLIGVAFAGGLAIDPAGPVLLFSPFFLGALLAAPIAVGTSLPAVGSLVARVGLWCTPEEVSPEPMLRSVGLSDSRFAPGPMRVGPTAVEVSE